MLFLNCSLVFHSVINAVTNTPTATALAIIGALNPPKNEPKADASLPKPLNPALDNANPSCICVIPNCNSLKSFLTVLIIFLVVSKADINLPIPLVNLPKATIIGPITATNSSHLTICSFCSFVIDCNLITTF